VGDVDNNLNRADAVLNKANPQNLDLLVLPELAFSGTLLHDISWISLAVSAVSRMSEHHLDRNIYSELRVSTCTVIQISFWQNESCRVLVRRKADHAQDTISSLCSISVHTSNLRLLELLLSGPGRQL